MLAYVHNCYNALAVRKSDSLLIIVALWSFETVSQCLKSQSHHHGLSGLVSDTVLEERSEEHYFVTYSWDSLKAGNIQ